MDKDTQKKLMYMGAEMPKELKEKLFKQEDTWKEWRGVLKEAVQKKGITIRERENLKRELDKEMYYKKELKVNPEISKEVERFYEGKIKAKIKTGELKKPQMDAQRKHFLGLSQKK